MKSMLRRWPVHWYLTNRRWPETQTEAERTWTSKSAGAPRKGTGRLVRSRRRLSPHLALTRVGAAATESSVPSTVLLDSSTGVGDVLNTSSLCFHSGRDEVSSLPGSRSTLDGSTRRRSCRCEIGGATRPLRRACRRRTTALAGRRWNTSAITGPCFTGRACLCMRFYLIQQATSNIHKHKLFGFDLG